MTKKINAPFPIKKLIALTIPVSVVPMFVSIFTHKPLPSLSNGFHVAFSASFESPRPYNLQGTTDRAFLRRHDLPIVQNPHAHSVNPFAHCANLLVHCANDENHYVWRKALS
jgi:hypothetical protein